VKNSIVIFVLSCLYTTGFSQIACKADTLRFAPDSSYSRAIVRYNQELVFGTSKNGVVALNEKNGTTRTLIPENVAGEFRDLLVIRKKLYAMSSTDIAALIEYENRSIRSLIVEPGAFFDDIVADKTGIALLGDPFPNSFYLKYISNRAESDNVASIYIPNFPDEACYAASGTTAQFLPGGDYVFVSGGPSSVRFFRFNWKDTTQVTSVNLPLAKAEGAGPFSVFFWNDLQGVCVGGNYTKPNETSGTACFTNDGGKTWFAASTLGYRSSVTGNKKLLLSCGTNGIDYSLDGGKTWSVFQKGNFCALLLEKNTLYATTNRGYCIRFNLRGTILVN
jgi:hypothetical protein